MIENLNMHTKYIINILERNELNGVQMLDFCFLRFFLSAPLVL